jgi:hypothetical protein
MSRRGLLFAWICLVLTIVFAGILWWDYPALSTTERQLLGRWTAPNPNPRSSYITNKGPVTNPWLIWEFRRDRSFRVWIVSADDPGVSILDREGRWYAEGAKLSLEGFGAAGDVLREIREHVRVKFGGSYVGRTSGGVTHFIRFLDRDNWDMASPDGRSIAWKRRR